MSEEAVVQALFALISREELPLVGQGTDPIQLSSFGADVNVALVPVAYDDDDDDDSFSYRVSAHTVRPASPEAAAPLLKLDRSRRGAGPSTESTLDPVTIQLLMFGSSSPAVAFMDDVYAELEAAAKRLVQLACWRLGILEPLTVENAERKWSLDGEHWHNTPLRVVTDPYKDIGDWDPGGRNVADFRELADAEQQGVPLAREILLEAVRLEQTASRASLTLAAVSAEVGLKQFAAGSSASPSEGWLIMTLQSPPLFRLTRRYLPFFTEKRTLDGKIAPPELLKTLDDASELRNEIVHAGAPPPARELLTEILAATSDFLYMLDWFAGYEWAFQRLRPHTRSAWVA